MVRGDGSAAPPRGRGIARGTPRSAAAGVRIPGQVANALKLHGVKRGDFVTIYMPMIPSTAMAMLACTRVGAPHSVVFAGFTSGSLRDRIQDSQSQWVCTADVGKRGSKTIKLKEITDAAVADCPLVKKVFVFKRTGEAGVPYGPLDVHMDQVMPKMRPYCQAEPMGSEDTMFTLSENAARGSASVAAPPRPGARMMPRADRPLRRVRPRRRIATLGKRVAAPPRLNAGRGAAAALRRGYSGSSFGGFGRAGAWNVRKRVVAPRRPIARAAAANEPDMLAVRRRTPPAGTRRARRASQKASRTRTPATLSSRR